MDGKIPETWKTANVIALHKKDSKNVALNYRPVSLTCIICKVYEQLIRRHIINFVNNDISKHQHGFVSNKSCFSNLLETVDTIIDMLENGGPVDIFYFDFCKAFDSVPHYRLLTKLESIGINGKTLEIIRDFLSGRSMISVVRGVCSSSRPVLSGVPQGSVLGPLLFVLFINDLPDGLKNIAKLFADDLKLVADASDPEAIAADIKLLENWEYLWLLRFNVVKCKVMHLNFNSNDNREYVLDNVPLKVINTENDLGLVTCNNLNWLEHIKTSIKEANKLIGWITRNIVVKDRNVMLNIYKTLIRPKLEYCVQIWNPVATHGNWSLILELESVQRRYTRLINDIGTLSYSERLDNLNLTTLAERRIRGDLIETYKILSKTVEYGKNVFNVGRSGINIVAKRTISNSTEINKLRLAFLPNRVSVYWNKLPISVKLSRCHNVKKNCHMFSVNMWA